MLNVKNRHLNIFLLLAFGFTAQMVIANEDINILVEKTRQDAGDVEDTECPICLALIEDQIENGIEVQSLSCHITHKFCTPCINGHISRNSYQIEDNSFFNCPKCRAPIRAIGVEFLPGQPDNTPLTQEQIRELEAIAGVDNNHTNNQYNAPVFEQQNLTPNVTQGRAPVLVNNANKRPGNTNNINNIDNLATVANNQNNNVKFYVTEALAAFATGIAANKIRSSSPESGSSLEKCIALTSGLIIGNKVLSAVNPERLNQPEKLAATWLIGSAVGYLVPKLFKKQPQENT